MCVYACVLEVFINIYVEHFYTYIVCKKYCSNKWKKKYNERRKENE